MFFFWFRFFLFLRRRRNDENVTLETICHDPQKRLYGHMLDDSSSEQCVMKEKKDDGGLMFMCSCTGEECNDVLIFSEGEFNNLLFILELCLACGIKSDIKSSDLWNCLLWRKPSWWLETFWPLLRLQNLSLSFVLSGHISSCQVIFLLKQFRYSSQHVALESHLNDKNNVLRIVSVTDPNATSCRTQTSDKTNI